MYYSHYSIIKYISFELILYVIGLDTTSFSKVFSEFYYMLLSNILLVFNTIIYLFKKNVVKT